MDFVLGGDFGVAGEAPISSKGRYIEVVPHQISSVQLSIELDAFGWSLAGQGAATEEEALSIVEDVESQATPQEEENLAIAMSVVNTRPACFDRLLADFLRHAVEVVLTGGIETAASFSHLVGLQTIGADELVGGAIFHQEVVALTVKAIFVAPSGERLVQSFAQLEVEDLETESENGVELRRAVSEAYAPSAMIETAGGQALGKGRVLGAVPWWSRLGLAHGRNPEGAYGR